MACANGEKDVGRRRQSNRGSWRWLVLAWPTNPIWRLSERQVGNSQQPRRRDCDSLSTLYTYKIYRNCQGRAHLEKTHLYTGLVIEKQESQRDTRLAVESRVCRRNMKRLAASDNNTSLGTVLIPPKHMQSKAIITPMIR